jgi:hypothetical protein
MRTHIERLVARQFPGSVVESIRRFGIDEGDADAATTKAVGYGKPLQIRLRDPDGVRRCVVLHTASGDEFGHDRRADRAAELLLAYDTFNHIPRHVRALDVGTIGADHDLTSIADGGEFYLLTEFAEGTLYADDLRHLATGAPLGDRDLARCDRLVDYLVELHAERGGPPAQYARSIRDLVGHGEGIFGLIDGFHGEVPAASPMRLQSIEAACVRWRWRLRDRHERLARIHGDFHPFNILFRDRAELSLLDAARGCRGDAADDAVCISLNYLFFAVGHQDAWADKLGVLWTRFWDRYLAGSGDREVLEVAPPYVAWRALVMANPSWYPAVTPDSRDALLSLVERTLAAGRFDPAEADAVMS